MSRDTVIERLARKIMGGVVLLRDAARVKLTRLEIREDDCWPWWQVGAECHSIPILICKIQRCMPILKIVQEYLTSRGCRWRACNVDDDAMQVFRNRSDGDKHARGMIPPTTYLTTERYSCHFSTISRDHLHLNSRLRPYPEANIRGRRSHIRI